MMLDPRLKQNILQKQCREKHPTHIVTESALELGKIKNLRSRRQVIFKLGWDGDIKSNIEKTSVNLVRCISVFFSSLFHSLSYSVINQNYFSNCISVTSNNFFQKTHQHDTTRSPQSTKGPQTRFSEYSDPHGEQNRPNNSYTSHFWDSDTIPPRKSPTTFS